VAIPRVELERAIDAALAEDLALGDPTTAALITPERQGRAVLVAREAGVACGVDVATAVFQRIDPTLSVTPLAGDGQALEAGGLMLSVEGALASILSAERTAVNFAQRMSGIATLAASYVKAIEGTGAIIVDTRKTAPGLRVFDKHAVASGGGRNHRQALGDGVLIKDNHIDALRDEGMSIAEIVARARESAAHTIKIEVEVQSLAEARDAMEGRPDILLLDNMNPDEMRKVVELLDGRALTEASGGISLENVAEVAASGVDLISIGALTHSPRALDISLDYSG
jgi:nicotinate-nucleotide pyrophosphorylase (carboxylating)